mgnify:CR=1 FL=1
MGIPPPPQDKQELSTKLANLLKDLDLHTPKYVTAITHSLIRVLETDSRWLEISTEDLEELSNRYSKKIPTGDFKITFGKIFL